MFVRISMCVFVVKTNAHSERAPGASSLMRMLLTARLARKHEASVHYAVSSSSTAMMGRRVARLSPQKCLGTESLFTAVKRHPM